MVVFAVVFIAITNLGIHGLPAMLIAIMPALLVLGRKKRE